MKDRFHFFESAEIFKAELFKFTLAIFDIETKMFPGMGIGTDGDDLAA